MNLNRILVVCGIHTFHTDGKIGIPIWYFPAGEREHAGELGFKYCTRVHCTIREYYYSCILLLLLVL